MEQRFYCYKITNLLNGKIYIGKAVDVNERWRKHKVAAVRQDSNDYSYLHRAMNKYGFDNFKVEVIAEFQTEKESLDTETHFIKFFNSNSREVGYNLTEGGEGSSGFRHTPESRQKMSQTKIEMDLSGDRNPFYGIHHTNDSKKKMSESHIEYYHTHDHPWQGRKHTENSVRLMSLAATGRKLSVEVRQKMSDDRKGDPRYISTPKLLESDVVEIKKLLLTPDITQKEIAKRFGVSRATITMISLGKTWSHIKI